MAKVMLRAKLLRWGNSYGVRISKADVDQLGMHPGDDIDIEVLAKRGKVDLSFLRTLHDGGAGADHDRILDEALDEDLR
jgi:hypothetical protein